MIKDFNFAKWFLLMLPMILSAGPANIMSASLGATQGFQKTIPFLLGLVLPAVTYSLLVGFGAEAVITRYPVLVDILQYAGAVYIVYLAMRFLYPGNRNTDKTYTPHLGFRSGFILAALNGKLITMLILMYSVMLDGQSSSGEIWLMTFLLLVFGLSSNSLWVVGGQLLSHFFVSDRAIRAQNIVFGGMLLVVAVWIAVT